MKLGFDFGNCYSKAAVSKTVTKDRDFIFPSGFTATSTTTGEPDEMFYEGQYYNFNRRLAPDHDKTKTDTMLICTVYAAVHFLDISGADPEQVHTVDLGTDISIFLFGEQRSQYVKYYGKASEPFEVGFHGKKWKIRFGYCGVYPQGVVAWEHEPETEKEEEQDTVQVICDIGGRDTDVAVVAYNDLHEQYEYLVRFSLQNGVNNLTNSISQNLMVKGIQVPESVINSAVRGNKVSHSRSEEIQAIVDREKNMYISQLLNELAANRVDLQFPVHLIGGGASMLEDTLKEHMNVAVSDGIMANARGCLAALEEEID